MGRFDKELVSGWGASRPWWIHAVSVGEFGVAKAFMAEWRSRNPEDGFVVTVNTSTGHTLAEEALTEGEEAEGDTAAAEGDAEGEDSGDDEEE